MRHTSVLCAALLLAVCTQLTAQSVPALPPGTRVRVVTPDLPQHRLVGELLFLDSDSIRLQSKNRPVTLPLSALTQLEVSRRPARRGGWMRGAGVGALAAIVGAAALFGPSGDWGYVLQPSWPVAGALVGSLIGAALAAERWDRIPLPNRGSIAPAQPPGFTLSASFPE